MKKKAPAPEVPPTPLPIARSLARTLRLFVRALPVALLVMIPFEAPLVIGEWLLADRFSDPRALFGAEAVYAIVWGNLCYAALAVAADAADRGRPGGFGVLRLAMGRVLQRWTRIAASLFIVSICTGIAMLAVIPGIWLWLRWSVVVPVVALEPMGKTYPLDRSALLMRGNLMRALVVLVPLALPEIALGLRPLLPPLQDPGPAIEWSLLAATLLARVLSVVAAYVIWRHTSEDYERRHAPPPPAAV